MKYLWHFQQGANSYMGNACQTQYMHVHVQHFEKCCKIFVLQTDNESLLANTET